MDTNPNLSHGILIYNLPWNLADDCIKSLKEDIFISDSNIVLKKNDDWGLKIIFDSEPTFLKAISRRFLKIHYTTYPMYPLLTDLTVHGAVSYVDENSVRIQMEALGPVLFAYKEKKSQCGTLTNNYRVIINHPEIYELIHPWKAKTLKAPGSDIEFPITFFCRFCRLNGHTRSHCPYKQRNNDFNLSPKVEPIVDLRDALRRRTVSNDCFKCLPEIQGAYSTSSIDNGAPRSNFSAIEIKASTSRSMYVKDGNVSAEGTLQHSEKQQKVACFTGMSKNIPPNLHEKAVKLEHVRQKVVISEKSNEVLRKHTKLHILNKDEGTDKNLEAQIQANSSKSRNSTTEKCKKEKISNKNINFNSCFKFKNGYGGSDTCTKSPVELKNLSMNDQLDLFNNGVKLQKQINIFKNKISQTISKREKQDNTDVSKTLPNISQNKDSAKAEVTEKLDRLLERELVKPQDVGGKANLHGKKSKLSSFTQSNNKFNCNQMKRHYSTKTSATIFPRASKNNEKLSKIYSSTSNSYHTATNSKNKMIDKTLNDKVTQNYSLPKRNDNHLFPRRTENSTATLPRISNKEQEMIAKRKNILGNVKEPRTLHESIELFKNRRQNYKVKAKINFENSGTLKNILSSVCVESSKDLASGTVSICDNSVSQKKETLKFSKEIKASALHEHFPRSDRASNFGEKIKTSRSRFVDSKLRKSSNNFQMVEKDSVKNEPLESVNHLKCSNDNSKSHAAINKGSVSFSEKDILQIQELSEMLRNSSSLKVQEKDNFVHQRNNSICHEKNSPFKQENKSKTELKTILSLQTSSDINVLRYAPEMPTVKRKIKTEIEEDANIKTKIGEHTNFSYSKTDLLNRKIDNNSNVNSQKYSSPVVILPNQQIKREYEEESRNNYKEGNQILPVNTGLKAIVSSKEKNKTEKQAKKIHSSSPQEVQALIKRSKGVLKPNELRAFLKHVKNKKHPRKMAEIYSMEVDRIVEQLEDILNNYYRRARRSSTDDTEIRWLHQLKERIKTHKDCKACQGKKVNTF